jgi:hypothetical protein
MRRAFISLPRRTTLALLAVFSTPALAQAAPAVAATSLISTYEDGQRCTMMTFEGLADRAGIPQIASTLFNGWSSQIDADAGGTGNFANAPSPQTVMAMTPINMFAALPRGPIPVPSIHLVPASKISFYYSTSERLEITVDGLGSTVVRPPNVSGTGGEHDRWDQLTIQIPGRRITALSFLPLRPFTLLVDDVKICWPIEVDSIELTQAIQQWQTLEDLTADLQQGREPPVPIIAGKPAVLRVYMEPVTTVTPINVETSGAVVGSMKYWLQPNCTVEQQRLKTAGCTSPNFYFIPPPGDFDITITLTDGVNEIASHNLPLTARTTNALKLKAVRVCDEKAPDGTWLCGDPWVLATRTGLLRKIVPTATVSVEVTPSWMTTHIDTSKYAPDNYSVWWTDVVDEVASKYTIYGFVPPHTTVKYFGMARPSLPGSTGGKSIIGGHGAASRTSTIRLRVETASETIAHETGHTLGLLHTNTDVPKATTQHPPGCYNLARDSHTDWPPVLDNRILDVGYDVTARTAIDPQSTFELMSYCVPRWISQQRYKTLITSLSGGPVVSSPAITTERNTHGPFWLVSGTIVDDARVESTKRRTPARATTMSTWSTAEGPSSPAGCSRRWRSSRKPRETTHQALRASA